ncbi:hypothetical protein SAMN06265379_11536 [Saccharicrinis carchari]|uniref:Uncharacterized protein n=1 Tax=Saccharicrinis carchari TaxID=1168039 RepID=A0A521F702_SACCC|nr:DUF5700 domain-containing putative Zn-dependent protease [Saccharicrinis carchari]SMO91949.1 hypothetical protein SAMN06265379_11536 [Saccharicrinis carchari]
MKKIISTLMISVFFLSCSNSEKEENTQKIKLVQNFESSIKILEWFDNEMPKDEIEYINSLSGIEIMESNVLLSNPDTNAILFFKEDLILFRENVKEYESEYGLNIAFKERKRTANLLSKIQTTNFDTLAIKRALQFFPKGTQLKTDANVYYVLTGWEWGDAYVRNVKKVNGKYKVAETGNPALVFNLSLFTKLYGETTEEQFQTLTNIMSHEIFHFAFNEFKNESTNYPLISDNDYKHQLFRTVQNEGIAHYIDIKKVLITNFSDFEKYQKENFEKLNKAIISFSSQQIGNEDKKKILQCANVGKYWEKYGAICGMFMSYHIERLLGKEAITKTIKNGAESFIETYIELQLQHRELPKLEI